MTPDERPGTEGLAWRKSTYSGAGNQCVEVAPAVSGILVRDSKNPAVPALSFAGSAWGAFMTRVRERSFEPGH